MNRKKFIKHTSYTGVAVLLLNSCNLFGKKEVNFTKNSLAPILEKPKLGEDIFGYIQRTNGPFNSTLYKQILGAANEFKEGDQSLQIAAADEASRINARDLLGNTKLGDLNKNIVYEDEILHLIQQSTVQNQTIDNWTFKEFKNFLLTETEEKIKGIMPSLSSDVVACLVKLMSNEELIVLSKKIFNPLPNSNIGKKGYMGARVQPNSPTDDIEDITWQVFNAWSYAVGDVVLGTNPVSSEPASVAKIENALFEIIKSFELEDTIPHCVLSHIDVQAVVEEQNPGSTGIWFQSLASTVNANKTFDVTVEKMMKYAALRNGHYGFYAETGQGADMTNGHGEGFDMVIHESRKYGFLRVLKQKIERLKNETNAWVHVNDVAGFIGPEVFRTKEQLVRCCLEDTVMGKLHGLTIGLDICSTLHMDVTLDDLDWCIDQVMPANPAYLMALPTKNDPMLSYLTTAFNNHVKIRNQFGYKVNDAMWDFYKKLEIIDANGQPTEHFGDPLWVYYKYRQTKKDTRSIKAIYEEGREAISRIENRGVPIAQGYGKNYWDLPEALDKKVHYLYEDAKVCLWTEMEPSFINNLKETVPINTKSLDRKDYVYHPASGEALSENAIKKLKVIKTNWQKNIPDIQIVISDGLNVKAIMDNGHLAPFLSNLNKMLSAENYTLGNNQIFINNGRVRAGYACGELLFGERNSTQKKHGIIHIIGERPGSEHHNFSAYLTVAEPVKWNTKGTVDHDITRVVSGISDTALNPIEASNTVVKIITELFNK